MLLVLKDNLRINSGTKSKPFEYIVAQQKILMKKRMECIQFCTC